MNELVLAIVIMLVLLAGLDFSFQVRINDKPTEETILVMWDESPKGIIVKTKNDEGEYRAACFEFKAYENGSLHTGPSVVAIIDENGEVLRTQRSYPKVKRTELGRFIVENIDPKEHHIYTKIVSDEECRMLKGAD